jgi:aminopeptidase
MDLRDRKLAKLICDYSVKVKKGDRVGIYGSMKVSRGLMVELYKVVLERGGHPHILLGIDQRMLGLDGLEDWYYQLAKKHQLKYVSPIEDLVVRTFDVRIKIIGSTNSKALSNVDPAKQATVSGAHRDLVEVFMRRMARGEMRYVVAAYPTESGAQEAEMSLREYEDFVYGACMVDRKNPVREWQRIHKKQEEIVRFLKGKKLVRIKGGDIDLELSVAGREWISCDGLVNMPDGELYTGPVEDSARGWVRFSFPVVDRGREVEGVELKFEKGKVVVAKAKKNEEFLKSQLRVDRGASYLGELGIGTNFGISKFTKEILFDEKIGGTIHLALGVGFPETGSKNKSAIHWDMICDLREDGEMWVDGEKVWRRGKWEI